MTRNICLMIRLALLACLLLLTGLVLADASQADGKPWLTVSSGSAAMSGGGYALGGTLGQMAAGPSSGAQRLGAGFWYGVQIGNIVYIPLVLK